MSARHRTGPQLDLFIPYITDLPLRDTRETMERPFFSLAKRKRLTLQGALRMEQLLADLRAYTQVSVSGQEPTEDANSDRVLDETLSILSAVIHENQVTITRAPLPSRPAWHPSGFTVLDRSGHHLVLLDRALAPVARVAGFRVAR